MTTVGVKGLRKLLRHCK